MIWSRQFMFNSLQASIMFLVIFISPGLKARFWLGWLWNIIRLTALVFNISCKMVLGSIIVCSWFPTLNLDTPNTLQLVFNSITHASSWWYRQPSKKGLMSLYASIAIVTLGLSLGLTTGLYLISTSGNSVRLLQLSPALVSLITGDDRFFSFMIINLIDEKLVLNRETGNMNEIS